MWNLTQYLFKYYASSENIYFYNVVMLLWLTDRETMFVSFKVEDVLAFPFSGGC